MSGHYLGEFWSDGPSLPELDAYGGSICEADGNYEDTYGREHYWNCSNPGMINVDGALMCEDHAGERGYGPKQEEYGFDPDDGLNPTATIPERQE